MTSSDILSGFPLSIRRGTNISHWLSQSAARGEERRRRFTRDDVQRLADWGLDHLRLPIDEEQLWDAEGRRDREAWDLMHAALHWCRAAGLRVVVDLHILRSHHFNAGAEGKSLFTDARAVERFVQCWTELSEELRGYPDDFLAYELLNEPVADEPGDWNRVLRAPYRALRSLEPRRVIAIGSNRWNSVEAYPTFEPPTGDPLILLVFHFYFPMPLTHYRARWTGRMAEYDGPIQYPGRPIPETALATLDADLRAYLAPLNQPCDREIIEQRIRPALDKAARLNLPLWCNEFGVYKTAPPEVRLAWCRDVRAVLERNGIAWSHWDYRGGFGLIDENGQPTEIHTALFGDLRA